MWGAISKTNHAILRWRDPIYKSARELAMSYVHEYCLPGGKKSMLEYSRPFSLARFAPGALGDRGRRSALADGRARRRAARAGGAAAPPCAGAGARPRSNCCAQHVLEWPDPRKPKVKRKVNRKRKAR